MVMVSVFLNPNRKSSGGLDNHPFQILLTGEGVVAANARGTPESWVGGSGGFEASGTRRSPLETGKHLRAAALAL